MLLLALLLPIRGAVAAAMPCAAVGAGQGAPAMAMSMAATPHEAMAQADPAHCLHDAQPAAGHGHAAGSGCSLCGDICSMTPLPGVPPTVPAPLAPPSVAFPDVSAPTPSFLSEGPERPPRHA